MRGLYLVKRPNFVPTILSKIVLIGCYFLTHQSIFMKFSEEVGNSVLYAFVLDCNNFPLKFGVLTPKYVICMAKRPILRTVKAIGRSCV